MATAEKMTVEDGSGGSAKRPNGEVVTNHREYDGRVILFIIKGLLFLHLFLFPHPLFSVHPFYTIEFKPPNKPSANIP